MEEKFREYKELEESFYLIDLLASEYGWSIEYIQSLTLPEVSCLLRCILRRKGVKTEDLPGPVDKKTEADNLIKLAKKLGASETKIKDIKEGKKVVI